jgi:hypothetical protein
MSKRTWRSSLRDCPWRLALVAQSRPDADTGHYGLRDVSDGRLDARCRIAGVPGCDNLTDNSQTGCVPARRSGVRFLVSRPGAGYARQRGDCDDLGGDFERNAPIARRGPLVQLETVEPVLLANAMGGHTRPGESTDREFPR